MNDRRNLLLKDPEMSHEVVPTRGVTPAGGAKETNLIFQLRYYACTASICRLGRVPSVCPSLERFFL